LSNIIYVTPHAIVVGDGEFPPSDHRDAPEGHVAQH
jgi:hypothetical protein